MNIWSAISSKKFFQALLDLLRTKDIPEVQMKLLGLIQKWGLNFEDKKNVLPNFFSVYNKLRMNNVQFPSDYESNYQQYILENNKIIIMKKILIMKMIIIKTKLPKKKKMKKYFIIWIV
jgi:hypothetical protein